MSYDHKSLVLSGDIQIIIHIILNHLIRSVSQSCVSCASFGFYCVRIGRRLGFRMQSIKTSLLNLLQNYGFFVL